MTLESVMKITNDFLPFILGVMGLIMLLLIIIVIILFKAIGRVEKRYRRMMRGVNNKNLEEMIISHIENIENANAKADKALKQNKVIIENMLKCAQKISIVRYRAFENIGSDLSFSIAMLDGNNDGIVLTGIYGREESTTYAKPIDKGISRYDLSEEESTVLNDAIAK